jgi:hypothetical protein
MPDQPLWVEFANAGAASQKSAAELFDERYGKYKDEVADNKDTESKLPQASLPQAPDPSPFKIGPG